MILDQINPWTLSFLKLLETTGLLNYNSNISLSVSNSTSFAVRSSEVEIYVQADFCNHFFRGSEPLVYLISCFCMARPAGLAVASLSLVPMVQSCLFDSHVTIELGWVVIMCDRMYRWIGSPSI